MKYYEGLAFFFLLLLLLLGAYLIGNLGRSLRSYTLLCSLLVTALIFSRAPIEALYLLAYLGLSLALIYGYQWHRRTYGRQSLPYHLVLFACLIPLVLCKASPLFSLSLFGFTGISYLCFRVVGIVIETYDGVIERVRLLDLLSFLLFFPSFSSGPVDRYRRFEQDGSAAPSREEFNSTFAQGLFLFLWGAIYKFVLSTYFFKAMGYLDTEDAIWFHHIGYAYAYGLYLFFDFAGYSRMAVGTAYCLGVHLPDNFRAPFLARDIKDFWDRWHITLSHWFRDYVFTRLIMGMTKKKLFGSRMNRALVGFVVNMGLMGLWHGLTPSYICYGLYHGLLLAGTEYFQKKSGFYKKHKGKRWYQVLSWFVTMQLVIFGFYLFSGKLLG